MSGLQPWETVLLALAVGGLLAGLVVAGIEVLEWASRRAAAPGGASDSVACEHCGRAVASLTKCPCVYPDCEYFRRGHSQ